MSAANLLGLESLLHTRPATTASATITTLPTRNADTPIYFARPNLQYLAYRDAIDAAIQKVLEGTTYILGEEVKGFEAEFAAYVGVKHGIGVANGTDAIHLALRAIDVQPDDEVITTAHTAIATIAAVTMSGAKVVLADVTADRYTLDPVDVARKITPKTKAIVAVHLYGHPADLGPLLELCRRHDITLIEDCAQAHAAEWQGRQVGSIGRIGCFSLYPTKNLGAIGDGGIVVTSDDEIAEKLRQLRQYGWKDKQLSFMPGYNSRLDEMQAAILRVKLRHLDDMTARRREIAARYTKALSGLPLALPGDQPDCRHAYHLYVVRTPDREALKAHLAHFNVFPGIHYPWPAHKHPAYLETAGHLQLPVAETVADQVLSLPMYPELTDAEVDRVIRGVRSFYG
ncbi:DegT/DnrJ/EryC1/StrS family aminotransferase [Lacibacterium aquatile]|uniref:DegT/DnrJ/EryC1/StrS family aminotransferase n=1 Tax=Lacibacterium aquatile TaxID=1168082 RepID=A0ABW5DRQ5_9PROT